MPSVYRTYIGNGTLTFHDKICITGPFTIECKTDGHVEGIITPTSAPKDRLRRYGCLRGRLNDGGQIVLSSLLVYGSAVWSVTSQRFHFLLTDEMRITYQSVPEAGAVELRTGFFNFLFRGAGLHPRLLGRMLTFSLLGNYSGLRDDLLANKTQLTSESRVIIPVVHVERFRHAIPDIASLISFAAGTVVSAAYLDIYSGKTLASTEIHSGSVYDFYDREPLIDFRNPKFLGWFLEKTFDNYQRYLKSLRLDVALEFCTLSKSAAAVLEFRFLMVFIAMEIFLSRLNSVMKTPHATASQSTSPKYVVLRRLKSFLKSQKLSDHDEVSEIKPSSGVSNYEVIRNRLAHSGHFPTDVDPLRCTLCLTDTFQRLLLAILGYRNDYFDCSNDFKTRRVS